MDWYFYNLILLVKQCKIRCKDLCKALLFSRKISFLFKKLKTLKVGVESFNHHRVQKFSTKFCTRFLINNVSKRVFGIFLFCLDLELFARIKKDLSKQSETPGFLHFY